MSNFIKCSVHVATVQSKSMSAAKKSLIAQTYFCNSCCLLRSRSASSCSALRSRTTVFFHARAPLRSTPAPLTLRSVPVGNAIFVCFRCCGWQTINIDLEEPEGHSCCLKPFELSYVENCRMCYPLCVYTLIIQSTWLVVSSIFFVNERLFKVKVKVKVTVSLVHCKCSILSDAVQDRVVDTAVCR